MGLPWRNHAKTHRKLENHGETMEKPIENMENHGETMEKPIENMEKPWKNP
jgi:hypothetical protein